MGHSSGQGTHAEAQPSAPPEITRRRQHGGADGAGYQSTELQALSSPSSGRGRLCTAPNLRAALQGTLAHRRQQQRGAGGAAAAAGTSSDGGSAWSTEKKEVPVGLQPPSDGGRRESKALPGFRQNTKHPPPHTCLPFPGPCRLSPPGVPQHHAHLEKGTLSRWEAVPVRRRQAPASPEGSHLKNRAARREKQASGGVLAEMPPPCPRWHHRGIKALHPNRDSTHSTWRAERLTGRTLLSEMPLPALPSPGAVNTCQRKEPTREAAVLRPDPELLWPE